MEKLGLRKTLIVLIILAMGAVAIFMGRDEEEPTIEQRIDDFLLVLSPDNFTAREVNEITNSLHKFNFAFERQMVQDSTVAQFVGMVDSLVARGDVETREVQKLMLLVGEAINRQAVGEGEGEPGEWIKLRGHDEIKPVGDEPPRLGVHKSDDLSEEEEPAQADSSEADTDDQTSDVEPE